MTADTTPDFDAIVSDLRRWYYSEIRSLADEAIKECNAYHTADDDAYTRREWLDAWLHETIDGHEFVIYTCKAKCSLLASDNEDALEQETGESGTAEQRCYWAMRRDVVELIGARSDEWDPRDMPDDEACDHPDCPLHLDADAEHLDGTCTL